MRQGKNGCYEEGSEVTDRVHIGGPNGSVPIAARYNSGLLTPYVHLRSSYDTDLAIGLIPGITEDSKFGTVEAQDAADNPVTIWRLADDARSPRLDKHPFPTSAFTLYATSSDGSDTAVTLTVDYIDANGYGRTVDVTLTGQTPVQVSATGDCLNCNRAENTGGTAAAGDIYLMQGNSVSSGVPSTIGDTVAFIPVNYGQTQQAAYTVPVGYAIRMKQAVLTISRDSGADGSAEIHVETRKYGKTWIVKREWHLQNGVFTKPLAGLVFPARTSIQMIVQDVSDLDTNVTGEWHYDLVAV